MFLKQLEIIGFKSFADKVKIDFVPGVTAIVGPNGSGKSNITDAIRWVLGEQSAKSLRGGKMEDIIFAGSDSRKPLNFAEVSLTLDNEDGQLPVEYNEVCVTRRVFRSGESEFLINGNSCRLKDIIDLFIDSGLGKEAFSIIGQGKVDEILNSKPEDRRIIFEEAAGVLKYKNRKKKAEERLQETTDNLNRVNDIIHELGSQLEPLKIQATKAKEFLQKEKELQTHEIALTVYEIETTHSEWTQLKNELEELVLKEKELSTTIQMLEQYVEKKRESLSEIDLEIEQLQDSLLSSTKELENIQGRLELQKERKYNATNNSEQLQQSISDTENKIKQLKEKQIEAEKELKIKEKEIASTRQEIKNKKKQIELLSGTIEETIESLKSDYIEILNEQATAKNERHILEQQLEQQILRKKRLEQENEKYIKQRLQLNEEFNEKQKEFLTVEKEIEEKQRQFEDITKKIQILKEQFDEKSIVLQKARQYIQKAESRKETLEEMEEDYTGFYQGVKEVLKAKNQELAGIEGAVAEIIQVPRTYAIAIETALAGAMQYIVVNNQENARKAIDYLKKRQLGRATFMPLDVIKGRFLPESQQMLISNHPAFIGIASELVHFDKKYEQIVHNLLGNIVIAKDLVGANQLAKILQYRVRIVTLEGDVVNPGGSMTGGATKQKNISLIGRKSELKELSKKLDEMKRTAGQIENEWMEVKQRLEHDQQQLEELKEKTRILELNKKQIEAELKQIKINKENIDDRLTIYDFESNEIKNEKARIKARMKELDLIISQCNQSIQTLNEQIQQLTQQMNHERHSKEILEKEISELSSRLAVFNEQYEAMKKHILHLQNEYEQLISHKEKLQGDLEWLQNVMDGHEVNEQELIKQIDILRKETNITEVLVGNKRQERLQLQKSIEEKESKLKSEKKVYQDLQQTVRNREVQTNRLEVTLDNLLQKLREDYTISFERAKTQYPLLLSPEETRIKVNTLKREIEQLGPVNLGAIDEYERVNDRYQFLLTQQNDLTEAKTNLLQVMKEMDEEVERRFSITFAEIQSVFTNVFVALFGGGHAELRLTNPDDLLHTGVEIVAQPPGKKLQNLSLLSGGERALTAIALLFSILKVRPVPFCVLDEVEAALDEANVHRFSHFLKEFSNETQFIVITHRQGTMEGADVLYGVTMQESGVSSVISVKLENAKEVV